MAEKKRSIFEEVGGAKTAPVPRAGGLIEKGRGGARRGPDRRTVGLKRIVRKLGL